MRIIGGSAGGRKLRAPSGSNTRPTSDRVREAIFNILGPPPADALVLDLFAGSGGLGLEAISRGAKAALFIEHNQAALKVLRQNIAELQVDPLATVQRGDSIRVLRRLQKGSNRYHWIFIDPPYATDLAHQALESLGGSSVLESAGTVIVEHDHRQSPAESYGCLIKADIRRYGDTSVSFYEMRPE